MGVVETASSGLSLKDRIPFNAMFCSSSLFSVCQTLRPSLFAPLPDALGVCLCLCLALLLSAFTQLNLVLLVSNFAVFDHFSARQTCPLYSYHLLVTALHVSLEP
ncbi:hypothetical protein PanWU01x14_282710 [Parasponia andersonii]|uniref:Uncharacterized protein n=1 Tax=Parasponia andersonii TaxID=3476 RepID=A0A2P5B0M3_PARAD|nr:hypothetical protein PanWU01x14_282710 [Parasponia andersonii]